MKGETSQIQELLFLKQLETDGANVIWQQDTLNLIKFIDADKLKQNNTNYKRELTKKKP